MLDKNKTGITLGIFFAVVHAAWALLVLIVPGILQSSLNWIFRLHFLQPIWSITTFNLLYALGLIIVTFIVGYILGWVFAWAHNLHHKKK